MHAVSPPPDGGYAGFNTAEGENALLLLLPNVGAGNTAVGWFSLGEGSTESFNTGLGAGALVLNAGDSNTAVGLCGAPAEYYRLQQHGRRIGRHGV